MHSGISVLGRNEDFLEVFTNKHYTHYTAGERSELRPFQYLGAQIACDHSAVCSVDG